MEFDRRSVLAAGGIGALLRPSAAAGTAATQPAGELATTFIVNGKHAVVTHDVRTSLLDLLRERLGLTGTKKGCDQGQCGACTVHINGERKLACLTLAVTVAGDSITTIEGIETGTALHAMQQAFIDHDALQCGFCTPGQIMSALGLIKEGHARSPDDIRDRMSGNLCRCAAYPQILAAIVDGAQRMAR